MGVAGTRGGRRITTRARVRANAARARARLPATTTGTTTAAMAATVPAPRARARGQRARERARVRATTTIEALAAGSGEHSLNLAVQHAVADSFVSRAGSAPHGPHRADPAPGDDLVHISTALCLVGSEPSCRLPSVGECFLTSLAAGRGFLLPDAAAGLHGLHMESLSLADERIQPYWKPRVGSVRPR